MHRHVCCLVFVFALGCAFGQEEQGTHLQALREWQAIQASRPLSTQGVMNTQAALSTYEGVPVTGQCVAFARAFAAAKLGSTIPAISPRHPSEPGAHWIWDDSELQPTNTTRIANDGSNCPQRWDIIVWKASAYPPYGHIAIVDSASGRDNVTVVESNFESYEAGDIRTTSINSNVAGWFRAGGDGGLDGPPPDIAVEPRFDPPSWCDFPPGDRQGWKTADINDPTGPNSDGCWIMNATSDTPRMWSPALTLAPDNAKYVEISMSVNDAGSATMYFLAAKSPQDWKGMGNAGSVSWPLQVGGWSTYRIRLNLPSVVNRVLLKPLNGGRSAFGVSSVRFVPRGWPTAPTNLAPGANAPFVAVSTPVTLSWVDHPMTDGDVRAGDIVEVWNEDTDTKVSVDATTNVSGDVHSLVWRPTQAGRYKWRVEAGDGINRGAWSTDPSRGGDAVTGWGHFRARADDEWPLAPVNLAPGSDDPEVSVGTPVRLSWADRANSYGNPPAGDILEVYDRDTGQKLTVDANTCVSGDQKYFDWTPTRSGRYKWRVEAGDGIDRGAWSNDPSRGGDVATGWGYFHTPNSALSAPSKVSISPSEPTAGQTLTAKAEGATCASGELSTYQYCWQRWEGTKWSSYLYVSNDGILKLRTKEGEQWRAKARAFSGGSYGPFLDSATVTIKPPVTTLTAPKSVAITPSPATAGQQLKGTASGATGPSGTVTTYQYCWQKWDGAKWSSYLFVCTDGCLKLKTSTGEQWRVKARAADGTTYGPFTDSATITIQAPAPRITAPASVTITPSNPTAGQTLKTAASGATGPDGAVSTYEYTWQKWEGTKWSSYLYVCTDGVLRLKTAAGEQWRVKARAKVGTSFGPFLDSAPVTIGVASLPQALALTATAVAGRAGVAQIVVNLTSAADVEVRILNLAGRTVGQLPSRALPSGVSSLLWNGRSTQGTKVPAGTYFVEVTGRASDGSQARTIVPMAVNR